MTHTHTRPAPDSSTGSANYLAVGQAAQLLAAAIPLVAAFAVLAAPAIGVMWYDRTFTLAWNQVVATALVILLAVQAVRAWPTRVTAGASILSAGLGIAALVAAAV